MKVIQEPGSGRCGEYAVLMVLDHFGVSATIEDIIALVNTNEGTSSSHIMQALAYYDIGTKDITGIPTNVNELPELAMIVIGSPLYHDVVTPHGCHWVVYYQSQVFDSSIYYPVESLDAYDKLYHPDGLHELHVFNILQISPPSMTRRIRNKIAATLTQLNSTRN